MNVSDFRIELPSFRDAKYFITDFVSDDISPINAAISKCSLDGGGVVIIPRGIWRTGPIVLKSNVNLHLCDGAIVLFSGDLADYKLIYTNWEGFNTYRCEPQIYGKDVENVAITGSGVFDGNGFYWRPVKKFKISDAAWSQLTRNIKEPTVSKRLMNNAPLPLALTYPRDEGVIDERTEEIIWWPSRQALDGNKYFIPNPETLKDEEACTRYKDYLRPVLLNFTNSRRILLDGPTFQNSPAWCIHPWLCEHLTIKNIKVRNPFFSQNGDGIDIDSCKYVRIEASSFDVGDDAICIKSGKNEDGRKLNKPCEHVVIDNCIVYHGHGGFVVGSEMSGGVRDIRVTNLSFIGTDTGIRFKTCLGRGGVVEDIYIDNIDMVDIAKDAIIFTMGYDMDTKAGMEVSSEEIPEFKNIYISNVNCTMAEIPISVSGLNVMPVRDIYFENLNMSAKTDVYMRNTENIIQKNVSINIK